MKVFLDTSVLLTALALPDSDSAKLLQWGNAQKCDLIVSDAVLAECRHIIGNREWLNHRLEDALQHISVINIETRNSILPPDARIKDANDVHVLVAALQSGADYIVTLDWKHFLSPAAKHRLGTYPIPCTFPSTIVSPFNERQLPRIELRPHTGTFSIIVSPNWSSDTIRYANRLFYILDFPDVFSAWYDPEKFSVVVQCEPYETKPSVRFPMYLRHGESFLMVITWDLRRGFQFLVNDKFLDRAVAWNKVPWPDRMWVGSDRRGVNQINGLLIFHAWPRALSAREMRKVHAGGHVTLPERPASL